MKLQESPYIEYLSRRRQDGLFRKTVDCEHPSPGRIIVDGKEYVNFSTNDYLGLSNSSDLKKRTVEWTQLYGVGSGASRLVTGNLSLFSAIEAKVASLKGMESALIVQTGFQANVSILQALLNKQHLGVAPLVFSDRLNHSSMHLGCTAANVRQIRYRHLDMAHLAELLQKHEADAAPKFILTESVFSMDGDIAPMDKICKLSKQYNCLTICDDAHATGVLGENGAGLSGDADIVIGTFSKAMGSFGAYVACSQIIKDFLVNTSTGLIYSTALPPTVLGSIDAALDLLPDLEKKRRAVAQISDLFRTLCQENGLDTGPSRSQIVPVIVGEAQDTLRLSDKLKENGYWATAIRPPTVPKGTSRLRFSFCPDHREQDIHKVVEIIKSL